MIGASRPKSDLPQKLDETWFLMNAVKRRVYIYARQIEIVRLISSFQPIQRLFPVSHSCIDLRY